MSASDRPHRALDVLASYRFGPGQPPIHDPTWDPTAEAFGEALLHERAQLPPVVLGRCEDRHTPIAPVDWQLPRCPRPGFLVALAFPPEERFLCPAHGATLERAVRRWK